MSGANLTGTKTLPHRTHKTYVSGHRSNLVRVSGMTEPEQELMDVEKSICTVVTNPHASNHHCALDVVSSSWTANALDLQVRSFSQMPGPKFLDNVVINTTVRDGAIGRGEVATKSD